ncbi:MAG: pyridoxamine 5'-phosphate oxidase family protein [Streptosporangiaceae bacterium]
MPAIPESHRDLLDGRFATLATIGPDGRPQLSEVWFLREGDTVRGDAEITPDDDYALADQVGAKYDADLRVHDQPGQSRVKVTIRPVRVNAVDMRG